MKLVAAFLFALLVALPAAQAVEFESSSLTIATESGERHRFRVELALTPQQQAQGLMYRQSLAEDAGMLFVNQSERPMSMWMRNTLVPLDMLFFTADGRIVTIAEETVPLSETIVPSGQPVKGVLEVPAGTAARLGIAPGDKLLHPLLVP